MGSVDLIASCLDSIRQISDKIADAIVYLDTGCAEAFQMIGAFPSFLEFGARTLCSLENMTSLDATISWTSASSDPAEKIVVITSRLLSDAHRYILRCLSTHQNVQSCSIFTSISEVAHSAYVDSPLGSDAFHEYEALLLLDYEERTRKNGTRGLVSHKSERGAREKEPEVSDSRKHLRTSGDSSDGKGFDDSGSVTPNESEDWPKLSVYVDHFPMILCPLSPRVFVLPSESTVAEALLSNKHNDALSPGLPAICTGVPSDRDDITPGATLTAHFLYNLTSKLDMKVDIFSLGDLSKSVGKILTNMYSLYDVGRRNKRSAGLLLIDRSLDLLKPCCHGDSLVDRIFSSLPRKNKASSSLHSKPSQTANKNGHTKVERAPLDIRIPLEISEKVEPSVSSASLSDHIAAFSSGWNADVGLDKPSDSVSVEAEVNIRNGSLVCSESYRGVNFLEALLDRKAKDAAGLIKKWLMDIVRRDKIPLSRSQFGSSNVDLQLLTKVLFSQERFFIRNKGILQLAAAAGSALGETQSSRWDALASAERMLAIGAGDTSQSLSSQIRDLINTCNLSKPGNLHGKRKTTGGLLSFQDTLLLVAVGYILAGQNFPTSGYNSPFSWEEERSMKEAVHDAILEMETAPKFHFLEGLDEELESNARKMQSGAAEEYSKDTSALDDFDDQWGAWGEEDSESNDEPAYGNMQLKLELRDRVDNPFKTFHKLSGMTWRNQIGRDGKMASQVNFGLDNYEKKGFIHKILTMVLEKQDVPSLEYHSSAMGRFFKSGLGRLGLAQSKPSLGEQNTLLVFVVGGISCIEVFEAREAVDESGKPELEVVLGGTTLLTPDDMFELLLGSSSYI